MQVNLRILKGSQSGKLLPVSGPKFLIGRGEDCHLRPHSDMISRRHCLLLVEGDRLVAQDLGSKNGSYINDQRLEGEQELKNGDELRVGPLEFEVCLTAEPATQVEVKVEEPAVEPAVEKPQPKRVPASAPVASDVTVDDDVGNWLDEADTEEASRRLTQPDTRQFKLDETRRVELENEKEAAGNGKGRKAKKEKKEPGKLPPPPPTQGKDSKEAAAMMLRKLFNRG